MLYKHSSIFTCIYICRITRHMLYETICMMIHVILCRPLYNIIGRFIYDIMMSYIMSYMVSHGLVRYIPPLFCKQMKVHYMSDVRFFYLGPDFST